MSEKGKFVVTSKSGKDISAAVQEYSASKRRGIRIKLHDKIGALTFLSKREGLDKTEEIPIEKKKDGLLEALLTIPEDWTEEDED